jgi:ABC-2 type transport system ATP-binding protein
MEQSKNDTVLEVVQLTKVFRDFWRRPRVTAVDGLDLSVRRGEIFGLLGPNGSGKSTTIKMLLGLLHPTEGSISILGGRPADVAVRKRIGYLPEDSYLYRYLTPRETLMFYGRLFDLPVAERRQRTTELIEMTGLSAAADRAVGEFSKGMARRLGLAQALLNAPDLLVLDEPTSGLDPMGCRQVKDLLRALADRGTTILLTSHLLADVEHVCDRVVIMYDGRPRAAGTLQNLLETDERMTLNVPTLDAAGTKRLLDLLRKELDCEADVSRSSMNLEEFFVSVVKEAKETGGHSHGDDSQIAAFLCKVRGG